MNVQRLPRDVRRVIQSDRSTTTFRRMAAYRLHLSFLARFRALAQERAFSLLWRDSCQVAVGNHLEKLTKYFRFLSVAKK